MAWGRKKGGGRKEPRFGPAASLAGLRLSPQDRIGSGEDEEAQENEEEKEEKKEEKKPKKNVSKAASKAASKRKVEHKEGDDAPPPRERKPKESRSVSKRRSRSRFSMSISRLLYWCVVVGLWGTIALVAAVVWAGAHLPAIQSLEIPKRPPSIEIVGIDGSVLAERGEMAGANVALKDLPPYLPNAFIAIEDRRFYSHYGVDPVGIARAAVANLLHRGVSQGGSTLTQQLAKNLFLTQERTMQRKLQEVELALWLERKHSKNELLELYLNRVYFGSGAYGVEAAAQRYFGKSARQVTLAEAAMLAGLVKSPSRLAPNRNPEGAEKRAQTVLAAMAEAKFITDAQAQASIGHPAISVKPAGAGTVNYVADWIGEVLDDLVGQV
jgi:penicillin-binding protein 1A